MYRERERERERDLFQVQEGPPAEPSAGGQVLPKGKANKHIYVYIYIYTLCVYICVCVYIYIYTHMICGKHKIMEIKLTRKMNNPKKRKIN